MSAEISFITAAFAGLISFLSPCVLPLVPPYLSFIAGATSEQMNADDAIESDVFWRIVLSAVVFVLGFTTVFVALGASATFVGQFIQSHLDILAKIGGVIIIVFGLHFLGLFRVALFNREARYHAEKKPPGYFGSYVIGLAFAFGWTPCIGPVLAVILALAAAADTVTMGVALLFVYSLGLGIPFILAALAIKPFMRFFKNFRKHIGTVEKVMGGFLVLTGILFITGSMTLIATWLIEMFPFLATLG
ncbi:MAG: cytochrome c biogenesis protein CcdA [Pseudomonadota bacterium]